MPETTAAAADKFLTIRVSAELHDQLKELARRNARTIAAEVRLAIIERLNGSEGGTQ